MINFVLGLCFLVLPFITFKQSYDSFEYPKVVFFVILMNLTLALNFWPLINKLRKKFKLNSIDKLLFILLFLLLISWALNGFPAVSFWGQYYRYEGLITIGAFLIFYLLMSRLAKMETIHWFIAISGIFYSFYILISGILFQVFHKPVYTFNGRAAGTFGNPNFAAGFLALSFPYLLFHPKINSVIKIIMTPIFLASLLFTQSRSGLLAFFAVLILFLIKKYKYGLAMLIPIIVLIPILVFKIFPRYSPFNNQLVIWQKAILVIKQKPLFGWGLERFDMAFQKSLAPNKDFDLYHIRVDKAHNETLEYGAAGGIVALIIYLALIINTFKIFLKHKDNLWSWINLSALVAYFVLSQLNVLNITEYIFFYLILAVASKLKTTESKTNSEFYKI
jgi:O-antigen ligase